MGRRESYFVQSAEAGPEGGRVEGGTPQHVGKRQRGTQTSFSQGVGEGGTGETFLHFF